MSRKFDGFQYADRKGGDSFLNYLRSAGVRASFLGRDQLDQLYRNYENRKEFGLIR